VRVTVRGISVVKVDAEKSLLILKGAVPGPKGGLVVVREIILARREKV
jgi:large subunit ribosomal protein L3